MPLFLRNLTAARLCELSPDETVFFYAVGPLEDHGPHLPLGMDLLEADRLSVLEAERIEADMPGWTAVLMPSAPLGIDSNTTHVALTVRPHVLRDWLVDSSRALNRLGFRYFVCMSGHLGPKQLTAIEEAGKILRRSGVMGWLARAIHSQPKPIFLSASSALVSPSTVWQSAFWPDPPEHGGRRDTSVALALARDQVLPSYLSLKEAAKPSSYISRFLLRSQHRLQGYWGAPAAADPEHGETELHAAVTDIHTKLKAVLTGANPNGIFRSWYSLLPSNGSFFRAWIILVVFAIVMACWVYLTFDSMIGN